MTPKINVATVDFLGRSWVEKEEKGTKRRNGKQSGGFCICNMLQQLVCAHTATSGYM